MAAADRRYRVARCVPNYIRHPLAFVDESVSIGPGTRVWQFASVIRGTRLGRDCNVASCVTLDGLWAGDRVIFSPGVDIACGFLIGNDVFLGPNVVLCNDRWPSTSKEGFDVDLLRSDFVTVEVKSGAFIGANAVVLPGVVIGRNAGVAAGAVADRSVPDGYLLCRSGAIVPLKDEWRVHRMREARAA